MSTRREILARRTALLTEAERLYYELASIHDKLTATYEAETALVESR